MSMNLKYDINLGDESYSVTDILPRDYEGTVVIPETHEGLPVTRIGCRAFCKSKITSVVIPDSVVSIGAHAFDDCDNLKKVTMGKNVKEIGEYAFAYCNRLERIDIPEGVTVIERYLFYIVLKKWLFPTQFLKLISVHFLPALIWRRFITQAVSSSGMK
mgnify:CR=1 FL=1